ncbi:MAG: ATP-binding protein [Actinobacteria bacterium]|nr:ATP-binding protein [Actinomycetota bacterium]
MDDGSLLTQGSPSSGRTGRFPPAGAPRGSDETARTDSGILLTLPARAENLALVRGVVGLLAEHLQMPAEQVEDVKLAVTEACANVVRHAYPGSDGRLNVAAEPEPDCLTVVVSDLGRGLRPDPGGEGPGLGLPLMAALTHGLEIDGGPRQGSRLSMSFRPSGATDPPAEN